ncbi:MAG TPA: aspartyl-phosphate phosphatase Spo0E family protein [Bacillales bacterium]|nr:aspartyl-phosphate phosphatase Spo0E family protein [Bacillales bacterium]
MRNRDQHLQEIEQLRRELNRLGWRLPLFSEEIVKSSQKLDRLLNAFEKEKLYTKSTL